MSNTPLFDYVKCELGPKFSDETLAALAGKLDADTYAFKYGGDLSLTDESGLLSKMLEDVKKERAADVAKPAMGRTSRGRRGRPVRQIGGMDHVRDPDPAA